MKNKTLFIVYIIPLLCFSLQVNAQLDNTNGNKEKGSKKGILATNAKAVEKPKAIDLNAENGFKNAYQKEQKKAKQKKDDLKNKGIITQAKLNEERFLKNFQKINGQYQFPKIDQDLGSFRTHSKHVKIVCRDFQYPDGDRVTIYVNDIPAIPNIILTQSFQTFIIPLEVGLNKIAFKALNQGTSGPNTASFKVYNDSGSLLSSNEWNLATGAKATLLIAKDK